jgi:hypothetical protein
MASGAKRNQILLGIITGLAAKFLVMNLKVRHRAAGLASPAVSVQHMVVELFVQSGIKMEARPPWSDAIHDAFPAK